MLSNSCVVKSGGIESRKLTFNGTPRKMEWLFTKNGKKLRREREENHDPGCRGGTVGQDCETSRFLE